ncbi:MAG: TIGR04282 family arsenosugar biosynthesis glycosyltransferase [Burkholderiales bacterium]
MSPDRCSVLIFAKAPQPGQVKTRLIPALGEQGAANLHKQLLHHEIVEAIRADIGPVELWCAPDTHDDFFIACFKEFAISLHRQQGADLGEKMAHALDDALSRAPRALLIGSDCPMLDAAYLRQAATKLTKNNRVVIAPTQDGGYSLVGASGNIPSIFCDIAWSTARVMSQTRERLHKQNIPWHELPRVWDVDTPDDLAKLRAWLAFASGPQTQEAC